jgi:ABC-type lipoprotein release transport system permease subunit
VGVIVLAVMLIAGIVALMNSIPLSIKTIYKASALHLGVTPRGDASLTPIFRERLLKGSPVPIDRMMTIRASDVQVRSIVGNWPFALTAVTQEDQDYFLERLGNPTIEGRKVEAGQPEIIISKPLAVNLKKKLGDVFLSPGDEKAYSPFEVKIVGMIDSPEWVGITSYEYYVANHFPPIDLLLVWAKNRADQDKLDRWGTEMLRGENSRTYAWYLLEEETQNMFSILYQILNVVIFILVVVITIMMGMLISIYQSQRIPEFGLLQALGFSKSRLLKRVMQETVMVVIGGWLLGTLAAFGMLNLVNALLMAPNAFMLDTLDPSAYAYTIPVPIAILAVAAWTLVRSFRKFDPISIVERRLI